MKQSESRVAQGVLSRGTRLRVGSHCPQLSTSTQIRSPSTHGHFRDLSTPRGAVGAPAGSRDYHVPSFFQTWVYGASVVCRSQESFVSCRKGQP